VFHFVFIFSKSLIVVHAYGQWVVLAVVVSAAVVSAAVVSAPVVSAALF